LTKEAQIALGFGLPLAKGDFVVTWCEKVTDILWEKGLTAGSLPLKRPSQQHHFMAWLFRSLIVARNFEKETSHPGSNSRIMTLEQARRRRTWAGRMVALLIVLMFVALFDALVAQFRQPGNVFEALLGESVDLNGSLPEGIKDISALTHVSSSEDLQFSFTEIHKGFWLGGNMWRGKVKVSPGTSPGTYSLAVRPKMTIAGYPTRFIYITVFQDLPSFNQHSRSYLRRYAGVSPWAIAGLFLVLTGLPVVLLFRLANQIDLLLAQKGQAEIYKVEKAEGGYVIAFGLGTSHGVGPGAQVSILDPQGTYVGTAQVEKSTAQDSVGRATVDRDIRPGFFVTRS
jgi:hypothetical protein